MVKITADSRLSRIHFPTRFDNYYVSFLSSNYYYYYCCYLFFAALFRVLYHENVFNPIISLIMVLDLSTDGALLKRKVLEAMVKAIPAS